MDETLVKRGKILLIVNHDLVIYNFRKELVLKLLENNYDVYIASPYGERIPLLTILGAKHIEVNIDRHGVNPIKDLKLISDLKRIIKNMEPDVILTYTIKPNIYGGIAA